MNDARTQTSAFSAFLFAAALLIGGCAGSLTGPQPEAAPEKPAYSVDDQNGQDAGRNDANDGGSTSTGASRNSSGE